MSLRKKIKSFFNKKNNDLNIIPIRVSNQILNLETHPKCPKYVSFTGQCFHFPVKQKGVFTIEATKLRNWMINRDRGRSQFEIQFTNWLGKNNADDHETYPLSEETVHKTGAEFILDELENGFKLDCHCPACVRDINQDDMKLEQYSSGGWIYRMVYCRCGNMLASYDVMHFTFIAGAKPPPSRTDIIKGFKGS